MYWKLFCKETPFKNQFGSFVKIEGKETVCNTDYWVYIKEEDFLAFNSGLSFAEVFYNYPSEVKEFLTTGSAPTYTCQLTNKKKVIHKAYVTNAVANSVVFYAMSYLNNMNLSLSQILKLRQKYSLGNLDKKYFTVDELRESFVNQSVFFANLYKTMNENDRFEHFVDTIENNKKFHQIFSRYQSGTDLKKQYNRRVFHNKFECLAMRSDYVEADKFHENTGIFTESKIITKAEYYVVEMPFLENLKMRVCKKC